jgi:hypothetical protein
MICCSRPVQHGTVLTAVKAEPSGWPTASLDPGSGRRRSTRTKSRPTEITQQDPPIQVSTVSGDCREIHCEVTGLLGQPGARRVRGDTASGMSAGMEQPRSVSL